VKSSARLVLSAINISYGFEYFFEGDSEMKDSEKSNSKPIPLAPELLEMPKHNKALGATIIWGLIVGFLMFFVITLYLIKQHSEFFSPKNYSYFYLYRLPYFMIMLSSFIILLTRKKIIKAFVEGSGINKLIWRSFTYSLFFLLFASFGWMIAFAFFRMTGIFKID
jgi:uncharacterized membrane protein